MNMIKRKLDKTADYIENQSRQVKAGEPGSQIAVGGVG